MKSGIGLTEQHAAACVNIRARIASKGTAILAGGARGSSLALRALLARRALVTKQLIAALVVAIMLTGCDSRPSGSNAKSGAGNANQPHRPLPGVAFPHELRSQYPEISAFLDEFLGTCLVGDYAGYRRLVSRAFTPETKERFDAIYQAVEGVTVESIEEVDIPQLTPPVYLVVSNVQLSEERRIKLRETHRKVAILVFKELDRWRMAPAPSALQPNDQASEPATSAPTTTAPSYPWDEDGDY